MPRHHCHAEGCDAPCRPQYLMCRPHWGLVPRDLQRTVYATYRPGQCDDKKPSLEWCRAADAAVAYVAALEGRVVHLTFERAFFGEP
ncbi:MAG TPA: hypothetical protein VHK68_13095 [Gemmatimonadales bacterium]|nr:hypothetical protein [Gemmatimonadales bacterium]